MFRETTFYLSRVLGKKVFTDAGALLGILSDIAVSFEAAAPQVAALVLKSGGREVIADYVNFTVSEEKGQFIFRCPEPVAFPSLAENTLLLKKYVLDRQLVDVSGRKLVRVNDLRLAVMSTGTFLVAVDVGFEGLMRRLGAAKPLKSLLGLFGVKMPGKLILWHEVETVDIGHAGIKLSKPYSKLETLHVSDLADILEEMDIKMQAEVFSSLDDEKAADVLEELETETQLTVLESLSVEKAADLLEMMPADEVADILEEMAEERAEELLSEMESGASEEVRELMEYEDNEVGSIMTTDFIAYKISMTVSDVIEELRRLKPESSSIYYLYIVDESERLTATVSLRDLIVSAPATTLDEIMNTKMIYVYDTDDIESIGEIISKYNLLAVPVVDREMELLGMVVIDDIVYNLLRARRRKL
ncbi:PRC-barrel domain-containing protein [Sporobacter termitidis DSM 10068]|uniref:PRC-barrel domain-containing protein n=1 Tax=Sporobacter termitidis DSM 10068 TaxID=1123282 RepID=A0A1M5YCA6_9FIRM|nr:CBS domain-containing protein [Sporobacter termitidis]SHI09478.1 PRC-barrel domain-containing protein [Sporobacter termitidis DSM 10068]